jgi:hypothetical protein
VRRYSSTVPSAIAQLVLIGALTALAMGVAIEVGVTPVRRMGAGRGPFAIAATLVALVPLIAAAGIVLRLPTGPLIGATWLPPAAAWLVGRLAAQSHGTTWPVGDPDEPVLAGLQGAAERLDIGDVDGAESVLSGLRGRATPRTARLVDLWIRYIDEERRRHAGTHLSSQPTREAIAAEVGRLRRWGRPSTAITAAVLALGVVLAVGAPIATGSIRLDSGFACTDAQPLLARAEASPRDTASDDPSMSHLVLVEPGEPAMLVDDGGMRFERAAESRHDPTAADKLRAAGFEAAYRRDWETPAGRHLSAEIFAFATPQGAAMFHRQMTEYACRFSSLAFPGPNSELGLRVNYTGGDPIVEQIGWVDGRFRIVVTRSFVEPPPDHADVEALARRAAEHLASPH